MKIVVTYDRCLGVDMSLMAICDGHDIHAYDRAKLYPLTFQKFLAMVFIRRNSSKCDCRCGGGIIGGMECNECVVWYVVIPKYR